MLLARSGACAGSQPVAVAGGPTVGVVAIDEHRAVAGNVTGPPDGDRGAWGAASSGRGVELVLLVGAAALTTVALVSVELSQEHALTSTVGYLGLAFLGLFGVAHLAVRRWAPYADP